ncbi:MULTISPECIES: hypothetical protein [Bacillaceae]|uniref:hypothetical protein n=1 Tax=Shouchella oshimensis TaxID=290588 RepID=UPI0011179EBF|nr:MULTISPECIES: hypothetical protein [Bacillaceae]
MKATDSIFFFFAYSNKAHSSYSLLNNLRGSKGWGESIWKEVKEHFRFIKPLSEESYLLIYTRDNTYPIANQKQGLGSCQYLEVVYEFEVE